jgi:hypothetical protein
MRPVVQTLFTALNRSNIKNVPGQMLCRNLAGLSFNINNRDIIGGVLQQWVGEWMNVNHITWSVPTNTQSFPDFILANNTHLEVKTFNYDESPGFDIANFGSYINSLLVTPERLDDDYLIIGYKFNGRDLTIVDYWFKNVWELTGPSNTNFLSAQVKGGRVYNIRPKDWRNSNNAFNSRKDFVTALSKAVQKFDYHNSGVTWFGDVANLYHQKTGNQL